MADAETLNLALTPELAADLRAAVASGEYGSTDEIVSEALCEWRLRRMTAEETEELRRLAQEGTESGPSLEVDEAMARLRARFGPLPE